MTSTIETATRSHARAKPSGVSASPEGGRVYVSLQGSDELAVSDTGTHRVINKVSVGLKPVGIAVSH